MEHCSDEQEKIDEQKRWLDAEIEKMVRQRQEVEELQEVSMAVAITSCELLLETSIQILQRNNIKKSLTITLLFPGGPEEGGNGG